MRIRMSAKGQVVVPADLRRKYGLAAGDELEFVDALLDARRVDISSE